MAIHTGNFAAATLLSLLGCAAQPIESTGILGNTDLNVVNVSNALEAAIQLPRMTPDRIICLEEKPFGSLIPRTRCYTQRQLDQQSDEAQRWLSSGGLDGSLFVPDSRS